MITFKRLLYCGLVQLICLACVSQTSSMHNIRLFRFGEPGREKPGVILPDGKTIDVSAFGSDYDESFFAKDGITLLRKWLEQHSTNCPVVPQQSRVASCVVRPSKIIGIGLNYVKHAKESGVAVPKEPILFFKSTTALSGPNDKLVIPRDALKTDWEVELGVIIGKKTSYISEDSARNYIAGYAVINDYSERAWQLEGTGQWAKGKSADGFAPLGPWLVPADLVKNPGQLKLWLTVNGDTLQNSNTSDLVFGVYHVVSYLSRHMTLLPGDVIATGTPEGVGLGMKPPHYLKPGDYVETGIEGLGVQKQQVISAIEHDLGENAYREYQSWVALGPGGIPNTYEGFKRMKGMMKEMKNPLDIKIFSAGIGMKGDIRSIKTLAKRTGPRPSVAPFPVPHRQTDQHNDTIIRVKQKMIFDDFVDGKSDLLKYKLSYLERNNMAIFLKDSAAGNQTIVVVSHAEIGHIHPTDGSMHIILSPSDSKMVIEKGWGELHALAGNGPLAKTYMMIYSPRNDAELDITKKILDAALKYSSLNN